MKEPCCATCRAGSINCDGNGWSRFKTSPTCCWITWTASSTTAAPKYASEWWKPSTATSKPFLEGAVATRISPTYCSRLSAWRSLRPNSSFLRKPPKMRVSTNSRAEPMILWHGLFPLNRELFHYSVHVSKDVFRLFFGHHTAAADVNFGKKHPRIERRICAPASNRSTAAILRKCLMPSPFLVARGYTQIDYAAK